MGGNVSMIDGHIDEADIMDEIAAFMAAQQKAEESGTDNFVCPLCGGEAWWGRAKINNHLHCGCKKCGFRMME